MRTFTSDELARYDGKDGRPAYIGYNGKVYDVSDSFLWRNGKHQALHVAGVDLTKALDSAPHGADLLDRFPVVGSLTQRANQDVQEDGK